MIPLFETGFWFLRHGETTANRAGLIAGATDVPLTDEGILQAEAAAARLLGKGIAAVWSSPQRRARDTAGIVAARLDLPVRVVEGLGERNWGVWEGRPRSVLVRSAKPAGGEGPEAFRDRVLGALGRVEPPWPALVVAHSGTFRVIRTELGHGDAEHSIANASPVLVSRARLAF